MKRTYTLLTTILLLTFACDNNQDCCVFPEDYSDLIGSWQVYEYGYSPADEYIVESVPADPAQLLTFEANGVFTSNAEGFEIFDFYTLVLDSTRSSVPNSYYVTLFEEQSTEFNDDNSSSYTLFFNGRDDLKLSYQFCIEGCHVGVKRVD